MLFKLNFRTNGKPDLQVELKAAMLLSIDKNASDNETIPKTNANDRKDFLEGSVILRFQVLFVTNAMSTQVTRFSFSIRSNECCFASQLGVSCNS